MIEAGEYGRTNKGKILVFSWLQDENGKAMDNCVVKYVNGGVIKYWLDKDEKILKHSKNIIDLIEVGDYVNGDKIVAIDYTEDENGNYINVLGTMEIDDDYAYSIELRTENIKSIVTHEQFAQVEYKL